MQGASFPRPLDQMTPNYDKMTQVSERRVVFAKFLGREILGEWGRLLFSLLDNFSMCDYEIRLYDSIAQSDLGKYGVLVHSLPNLSVAKAVPSGTDTGIYLFDEEDPVVGRLPWRKKVKVKFDVFSSYRFSDPIIMPYPVHPVHAGPDLRARLNVARGEQKRMRAFFSGETAGYVLNRIQYPKAKLLRVEAMDVLIRELGDGLTLVSNEQALENLFDKINCAPKFVLGEPGTFRVDSRNWLCTLAKADFFLCLPGYVMPMCHNAAEAMAVGTIPIINYPEWFGPRLEHMKNCIVFDDKADLISKVNEVLEMGDTQVAAMRHAVIDYYESHMSAASFIGRIESSRDRRVVVLMVTDANTAKNAAKLGPASVLLRGTAISGDRGWLRRVRAVFR